MAKPNKKDANSISELLELLEECKLAIFYIQCTFNNYGYENSSKMDNIVKNLIDTEIKIESALSKHKR